MFVDADTELDKVDAELRHLPEVLAVRIHIYRALKKWELMPRTIQSARLRSFRVAEE
jgi:hypothetical protein